MRKQRLRDGNAGLHGEDHRLEMLKNHFEKAATTRCQIETARVLSEQLFLCLLAAIPMVLDTCIMYLCPGQWCSQASIEKFDIDSLDFLQVCIEKTRSNKTRAVSIWQERVTYYKVINFRCLYPNSSRAK